ncbi:AN1-type zinc finger protein 1-like [Homarus americanus]|uniref:AN1-type zinc finger protein 1-like n=1 Tax=Homarus americanus TaxID=6706 RepID=A0A8J5KH78_HOMAM|nr:AN1-type zinc finger protein 1-like [Homarus americanus]
MYWGLQQNQATGCNNGELAPVICTGCSNNFCLTHRHQVDHVCPAYKPPENAMAEAAVKIQQITDRLDATPAKKGQGRKSDKLSAKVQLMKLKQKSSGDESLPREERLYLMVLFPMECKTVAQPLFFSHQWTVGRAIDAAATIAKITNRNNILGADKLMFFHASDGNRLGSMDQTLKSLLEKQHLYNGQTVILEYTPQDKDYLPTFNNYKA